jgi:hypothetical protein
MTVQDLPYGKGVIVSSSSDLSAWALKDLSINGAKGSIFQSPSVLSVHQGYAVAVVSLVPANDATGATAFHTLDVYYASATGIWDVNTLVCGDDAWSNLASTLSAAPSYFEAPPSV